MKYAYDWVVNVCIAEIGLSNLMFSHADDCCFIADFCLLEF